MTSVGIIANPAAGTDIRRLVAHASPVSDATKAGVVRRAVLGAVGAGAGRVVLSRDRQALTERAVAGLDVAATIEFVDDAPFGDRSDTTAAAHAFFKEEVGAVIALGGDGTSRDVVAGWLDVPLIAVSTGTNNVFPRAMEGTVAGLAAAAVANGVVDLDEAADVMNVIHVSVERADGPPADEVALVDLALVAERFVGSRAVWDPSVLRELVACIAEPATIGLSAVAGLLHPSPRDIPGGVHVRFGGDRSVRAPLAPGQITALPIDTAEPVGAGVAVELTGPGVLSFDGEREVVLRADDRARCTIEMDGPRVIDVPRTLTLAATRGFLDGR